MTKEKFNAYQKVQQLWRTNMFDIRMVCTLSRNTLTREDCLDIMENYETYDKQFNQ